MEPLVFRTLVRIVAVYLAAVGAAFSFLRLYRPDSTGPQAALVAVPLAAAIGYFMGARACRKEERLILDAIEHPRLEDGRRAVAFGPVEALGPLLTSPITRQACVAYQYLIDHESRSLHGPGMWVRDYWGMAVTPFQIRTPAGPVRVLGYARLEGANQQYVTEEAYRAAEDYVRATAYRHPTGLGEREGSLAEPISTESDAFQDDICANAKHVGQTLHEDAAGLRKQRLSEARLDAGQAVCALGYYSAEKGALVPTTQGVKQLRIATQSPEFFAADNRATARSLSWWGVGAAVIAVAAALATRWW